MAAKQHKFKAEVQQLLDLVIHSLYSNKEIFLRELISNASDAIDRARFVALSEQSILEDDHEWQIRVHADREARTLTVSDNGIGMGPEDIDACIGTIASSGTRKFLEELQEHRDRMPPELIGQFGVGFYSAFMVADKVTVVTRHAGDPAQAVKWESDGSGTYTVEAATRAKRGTDVTLHLKDDAEEYLEEWRIRKIVKKFSDFVEHPVVMDVRREEQPTGADGKPLKDAEPIVKVEEETLNSRKALWQRPKSEVSEEEYKEFYKHISHDFQDPFETLHWNVEGATEFRALVFIPQRPPMDMFIGEERNRGIQLYVKRVFISDNCEQLIPPYLRFLRGVVDSSDLPLNVSREMLQEHRPVELGVRKKSSRTSLIMRNLDGAAADEFAQDGVAGDEPRVLQIGGGHAGHGVEQAADAVEPDAGVEEAAVGGEVGRRREVAGGTGVEGFEDGEVEGEAAVDDGVGQAAQGDDAEEFALADVVPVQERAQGAVVAVLHVAQRAAEEADVGPAS